MKKIFSKYYEIVLSVALFVVLDAGILVFNYLNSYAIAHDTHAVKLASLQMTKSQQLVHQLYQLDKELSQGQDANLTQLSKTFAQFDEILDSFIYGGRLIGEDLGADSLLEDINYQSVAPEQLKSIESTWQRFRPVVSKIVYSQYETPFNIIELRKNTKEAILLTQQYNLLFLQELESFSKAIELHANGKTQQVRLIQTIGISLAVINFFIIVFHFIRRLNRSDKAAVIATNQTDEILSTINEGIFLLDRDGLIGVQYSSSIAALFNQTKLSGKSLLDVLGPLVDRQTLTTIADFIDVLFSPHIVVDLVKSLNPLGQINLQTAVGNGRFEEKIYRFNFDPIFIDKKIVHYLVTAEDITHEVLLKQKLERSKTEQHVELELVIKLLSTDASELNRFIQQAKKTTGLINQQLKKPANSSLQFQDKLNQVARLSHTLKGDCASINGAIFEDHIHSFERIVIDLKVLTNLVGDDFIALTVCLNKFQNQLLLIEKLTSKLGIDSHQNNLLSLSKPWQQQLQTVCQNTAEHYKKQAVINLNNFDLQLIDEQFQVSIMTVLIQLIKNAVAHGIEQPELRIKQKKSGIGNVKISIDEYKIRVKDDGAGFNLNAIKQQLIDNKVIEKDQQIPAKQLINYAFSQGISTKDQSSSYAGHGIGLDLIHHELKSIGAKISLNFKRDSYSEFIIQCDQKHFNQQLIKEAVAI